MVGIYLTDFDLLRPQFENVQTYGVDWLAEAHTTAERTKQGSSFDESRFRERIRKLLERYGCGADRIGHRGHELEDFCHLDWSRMRIFRLHEHATGASMEARSAFYRERVEDAFERLFPNSDEPPRDLLHVTCTGYVSPSGAQRLVERRGWHRDTTVTHAYHMGCYASLPATRIAEGFLASRRPRGDAAKRCDIVHTELCTIHLNPAVHSPEQLIVQSLFGDGSVRYQACAERPPGRALELLALREELLPDSHQAMTWECADYGMRMTLAREVPELIADALREFVDRLFAEAAQVRTADVRYAVHPGGPRIIDRVGEVLQLDEAQLATSRRILHLYGNMSSATLPYIWDSLLRGPDAAGTLVVSLAFGPGLSVCGGLFRIHGQGSQVSKEERS